VAVTESRQFTIGAEANATDGVCGVVSRVIVDPIARAVTHLVVEPKHSRLVPLDLLDTAPTGEVRLRCTVAEFENSMSRKKPTFCSETATRATGRIRCFPGPTTWARGWRAWTSG
jgi:hypothetical protein